MLNLLEATNTAIELERKGHDLYISAAEKTTNKLGKETLRAIAAKEIDHIKAIEKFIEIFEAKSSDFNKAIERVRPMEKKDYLRTIVSKLGKELETKVSPDANLEKAYQTAMVFEKDSYELYKKLAGEVSELQAKKFFEFLMGEENMHYELLQDTLEYLNKPGEWFKQQEKWIVEG